MESILFWHWWVLGFGLMIAEILLPGTFCLWLGASAFVTGVAAWVFPGLGWQAELVLFAVLSFVTVFAWFRFRPAPKPEQDNGLNQRGRQYVGKVFELVDAIDNGFGKARVEDTVWRVAGPDLPAGRRVRVTAIEGATLRVEAAD